MDLGTFGAVVKFAIELENTVVQQYDNFVKLTIDSEIKTTLKAIALKGRKRISSLKRLRSENTTEMILEPIYGLDSLNYKIKVFEGYQLPFKSLKALAVENENVLLNFYEESGKKLKFLSEVAYAFEDFAEENNENIEIFQAF
jgi:hypothetical protein